MELIKGVFFSVVSLSVSGSVLFLLVWAVSRMFQRQISRTFAYYLWLLVVLRLVIPYQPEWGLGGLLPDQSWFSASTTAVDLTASQPTAEIESGGQNVGASAAATGDYQGRSNWQAIVDQQEQLLREQGQASTFPRYFHYERGYAYPQALDTTAANRRESLFSEAVQSQLITVLAMLWLVGALSVLFGKLWQYRRFCQALRQSAAPVRDRRVWDCYRQIETAYEGGRPGRVALYQSAQIDSPMLVGLRKPLLVLPEKMVAFSAGADGPNVTQLSHIFRHELIHYKRKDIPYKWLVQLVSTVHWFNPLVYLLGKKTADDCELSCDEMVCRRLSGEERIGYGKALLAAVSKGNGNSLGAAEGFCTTMGKEGKEMLKRLKTVKLARSLSWGQRGVCLLLALVLVAAGLWLGIGQVEAHEWHPQQILAQAALGQLAASLVVDEEQGTVAFTIPEEGMRIVISGTIPDADEDVYVADYFRERQEITEFLPGVTYTAPLYADGVRDFQIELEITVDVGEEFFAYQTVVMDQAGLAVLYLQMPYPNWQTAYAEIIRTFFPHLEVGLKWIAEEEIEREGGAPEREDSLFDYQETSGSHFSLFDLDNDGIPELFVERATALEEKPGWYVFTFANNQPQYLGNAQGTLYSNGGAAREFRPVLANSLLSMTPFDNPWDDERELFEMVQYVLNYGVLINAFSEADLNRECFAPEHLLKQYDVAEAGIYHLQATLAQAELERQGRTVTEAEVEQLRAAGNWARSYANREGIVRYNYLTEAKQAVFFQEDTAVVSDESLFWESGFISLRGSSPWVEQYSLEITGPDEVTILYSMRSSAPGDYYVSEDRLQFGYVDEELKVVDYDSDYFVELAYYLEPLTFAEALQESLRRANRGLNRGGELVAEGFLLLGTEEADSQIVAYVVMLPGKFDLIDGRLEAVGEVRPRPLRVVISALRDGGFVPNYTSEPVAGDDYWSDVFDRFPAEYRETIVNTQPDLYTDEQEHQRLQQELWDSLAESLQKDYGRELDELEVVG